VSRSGFTSSNALLHDLLDRFEARPAVSRHLAYIDYDGFKNITEQDRMVRELDAIERGGGILVRRLRDGTEIISHVRLAEADVLYRHLGRQPAAVGVTKAIALVRSRTGLPPTATIVLDELAGAWARGVSRFNLRANDAEGLSEVVELVLALNRRASDPTSTLIDYRTFSRASGVRSKALEQRIAAVVTLFDCFFPDLRQPTLDAFEVLATFGLARMPQPFLLSGPLELDGVPIPRIDYFGVPPEEGDRLGIAQPVIYMLTIENYASFIRHVREINTDRAGLVIYTGGFPARPVLRQIVRLAARVNAPVFHWGDMDAGGVRIFRHLEDALAPHQIPLTPHLMRSDLLAGHGMPTEKRRSLQAGACPGSAIAELWDSIAKTSFAHEQESFSPISPMARVAI
jgi:hypothetical protein